MGVAGDGEILLAELDPDPPRMTLVTSFLGHRRIIPPVGRGSNLPDANSPHPAPMKGGVGRRECPLAAPDVLDLKV